MPALILWGQHDRVSKGGRKRVRRRKGIEEEGRREQVGGGREDGWMEGGSEGGREGGKLGSWDGVKECI